MIYFLIGIAIGLASGVVLGAGRIFEQARVIRALEEANRMLARQLNTLREREMQLTKHL
jgi:hypothetical protein